MRFIASGLPVALGLAWLGASLNHATAAEFYRITPPRDYELPNGVSPDGSIVLTTEHVWTPAGGLVRFAPGVGTYSRDISNAGVVVGLTDGNYEPFRTPVGGPVQVLSTRGGDAFGITPDGSVVVGYATFPDQSIQAFRWTAVGGLEGLGYLSPRGVGYDTAYGVSADGTVIVGEAASPEGQQAFRWTRAAGMVGLGDLPGGTF
jgi:probable HAF family extracellular repeat protein